MDGVRAIAILLVLLYHLTPGHHSNLGLIALPFKIADLGWSGVDLFFVLSGFLITGKLLDARGEQHRFANFYARRVLRVFPLYYLTLTIVLILVPVMSGIRVPSLTAQLPFWLYYSNFTTAPLELPLQLGHFWSLAIEEQFYLMWPAIIFLTSERTARRVCCTLFAGALVTRGALAFAGFAWPATWVWTPSRFDGLAAGALLALVFLDGDLRARALRWSRVAFIATAPFLGWVAWKDKAGLVFRSSTEPETLAIRIVLPTALALFYGSLLVIALQVPRVGRALSGTFFTAIARYSYGMYVVHFLLLPLYLRWWPPARLSASPNIAAALFFLISATVSTLIAVISYHGFESFFLSLKARKLMSALARDGSLR